MNGNSTTLLLSHNPDIFFEAARRGVDLVLSGHTHGGQLTFLFPFFNPSVTHIETNYVKGDFWFDNMLMVVTRGLGMSLAPIRYNATPEITIVKLLNKNSGNKFSLSQF